MQGMGLCVEHTYGYRYVEGAIYGNVCVYVSKVRKIYVYVG